MRLMGEFAVTRHQFELSMREELYAQALAARIMPVSPTWQEMIRKALDLGLLTLDAQIDDPNAAE